MEPLPRGQWPAWTFDFHDRPEIRVRYTPHTAVNDSAPALKPTVYIPNLNGGEMLALTLESLAPSDDVQVVVVDNGSEDDSVTMLRDRFPQVELIALPENIGFGSALNLAVKRAPGDPLVFLNNDVECEPGFLDALLAALQDGVSAVAGVLVQRDAPELIDSAGVTVEGDTLMAFDYLHGESVDRLRSAPAPLGPTGGAALYRRDTFTSVGGFDERIFVYYEDVDLALRMRAAGHDCVLAPDARALHAFSATLGSRSGAKFEMTGWSRGYLLRRYGVMRNAGSAARALFCEAAICAGQLARAHTARGLRGRVRGLRAGGGLPQHQLPESSLLVDLTVTERLRLRAGRNR
jgi:N-acetylglucosaminyl-diphospho-decaprenol L-rhamnosyltransferase